MNTRNLHYAYFVFLLIGLIADISLYIKSPLNRNCTTKKGSIRHADGISPAVCGIQKAFPRFTAQKGKRSKLYKMHL